MWLTRRGARSRSSNLNTDPRHILRLEGVAFTALIVKGNNAFNCTVVSQSGCLINMSFSVRSSLARYLCLATVFSQTGFIVESLLGVESTTFGTDKHITRARSNQEVYSECGMLA